MDNYNQPKSIRIVYNPEDDSFKYGDNTPIKLHGGSKAGMKMKMRKKEEMKMKLFLIYEKMILRNYHIM